MNAARCVASGQLSGYKSDGFTQNYQLSWGNGGNGPLHIVVGGDYIKQNGVSSGDRALSTFPNPYSTSCSQGGCSSFLPNGRYVGAIFPVGGNDTLISAPTRMTCALIHIHMSKMITPPRAPYVTS